MFVDTKLIEKRFTEYNQKYFNNKLGKCRFSFYYTDVFGSYVYNKKIKNKPKSSITISKSVNWTEEAFKEVLIHEMIHMKIRTVYHIPHDGVLGHGIFFFFECLRIRMKYGIKIKKHPFHLLHLKKGLKPKMWEKVLLFIIDW